MKNTGAILSGPGKASDNFWALEKRLREDKRRVGVVAEMSRSRMEMNIAQLLYDGTITLEDLDGFSDEIRTTMGAYMRLWRDGP